MRYTRYLLNTVRETPSEAEVVSHRLMLRTGMIHKVAAGIYSYLPLALRTLKRISDIVRDEMNAAGAQELLMPAVQPAELWQESGRWTQYGKELLRLQDRHQRDFCLGPTHEEVITDIVRSQVRSWRQLPVNLYQIQSKFRDEIRPRFGLMRGREFLMKDAYSFDRDDAAAALTYEQMHRAYCNIFQRCGLRFRAVEADTGTIGGSFSHEFMVLAESGEDAVLSCDACDYAANQEKATTRRPEPDPAAGDAPYEQISTPGKSAVDEVAAFLGVEPRSLAKTLVYRADDRLVAVLVRGDHAVNEIKLGHALGATELVLADDAEVQAVTGAPCGFAGPVGLTGVEVWTDHAVATMASAVVGANAADTHLRGVHPGRDFAIDRVADLRNAEHGDGCPRCAGTLQLTRGIEVGHIFKLGIKYSQALGATYLNEEGNAVAIVMGCYGIGIGRTMAASIEQNNDADGIIWPAPIAPFPVEILLVREDDAASQGVATALEEALTAAGLEPLVDDRPERPGVKFKDADLLGLPYCVTVGPRGLAEGKVEIKERRSGTRHEVALDQAVGWLTERLAVEMSGRWERPSGAGQS
ncbi:MAG TPA: proline--tRNA ligase [bacterium]